MRRKQNVDHLGKLLLKSANVPLDAHPIVTLGEYRPRDFSRSLKGLSQTQAPIIELLLNVGEPPFHLNNRRLCQLQKTLPGLALKEVTEVFADDLILHN